MATTKITNPELFDLASLNSALKLPSGTTAQRPTSPSTGEWRYNTTTNLVEFWDGGEWRDLQFEDLPAVPSENFNVVLYNGTSATHAITGVGFKPDFVWIKDRSNGESHILNDSTRGAGNDLSSNTNSAQANRPTGFVSFDSDGFTLGADGGGVVNDSARGPYVAWCWKAGGGTTSSNTDGTITSTVQTNQVSGFSIVEYTGNGNTSQESFGHGLNSTPELIIQKSIDTLSTYGTNNWLLGGSAVGAAGSWLEFNSQDAKQTDSNYWGNQLPSSTVVYISGSAERVHNESGKKFINYCFVEKAGYSKFGTYTGNGSATGPIVNTGFEPAFVIIKRTDSADNWSMTDNARNTTNPRNKTLFPNLTQTELTSGYSVNYLSNGFQIADSGGGVNANGGTFLYIAFGSDPSAAPTLPDSFANKIYSGNGGTQSITGLGFSPSWVWAKRRSATEDNAWFDIVRGTEKQITSNKTNAQNNTTNAISSFDSDGWTTGANNALNTSGQTYVAWNWKINPLPTINTDGAIQSIVSANQAAGISIVKWDGTGSASTVGHGLGSAPEIIFTKRLNGSGDWYSFSTFLNSGTNPAYNFIKLNSSDAEIVNGSSGGSIWNSTSPTATVINVGTTLSGSSSDSYIAYCFTSISGFSKMGTYTGNSSTQSITGLGFQPNWLMIKQINGSNSWRIFDSARGLSAPQTLFANLDSQQDSESNTVSSFDSDGWTMGSQQGVNDNGDTYIYMAFKENPAPRPLAGNMSFLVVAGGGAAGIYYGAGGGAGGLRTSYGSTSGGGASAESDVTLSAGTYTITVGAGATGGSTTATTVASRKGTDSSIAASSITTITSSGGGGGATGGAGGAAYLTGGNGGSGGGAWTNQGAGTGTANQGFAGGTGTNLGGYSEVNGGGGGASSAGQNASSAAGNGGAGLSVSITGASVGYAGGGGAGGPEAGSGDGTFGTGTDGGGNGGYSTAGQENGTSGTANTGGGGGGGSAGILAGSIGTNGSGGSGVAILRLLTSEYSSSTTGSPTVTTDGDYTILTYTGSGTYVHS